MNCVEEYVCVNSCSKYFSLQACLSLSWSERYEYDIANIAKCNGIINLKNVCISMSCKYKIIHIKTFVL